MNVTTELLRAIKPGQVKAFLCEDAKSLYSGCTLVSLLKRRGMPEGVSDYETKKCFDENILLVRALAEGDEPIFKK